MGEAKRKKRQGLDVSSMSRRLAASWDGDSDEFVEDVFDQVMRATDPGAVIEVAAAAVSDEDRIYFASTMFDVAGNLDRTFTTKGGVEVGVGLYLFTLAVHGPESDIARMASQPIINEITRLVKKSGWAHETSSVVLCPVPIDVISAADGIMPENVRKIAEATLREVIKQDDGIVSAVEKLVAQPDDPVPEGIRIATRLFVGGRILAHCDDTRRDLFDPPDYCGDRDKDECIHEAHDVARLEARERFNGAAMAIGEANGLRLVINGPLGWTEGLGAMANLRVYGLLELEAMASGLEGITGADEVHYAREDDVLYVSVVNDGNVMGPVEMPLILAGYGADEMTDWMVADFKKIFEHEELATLPSRGRRDHQQNVH